MVLNTKTTAKIAALSAVAASLVTAKVLRSGKPWSDVEVAVAALHADLSLEEAIPGHRPAQVLVTHVQPFSGAEMSGRYYWHVAMAPRKDPEVDGDLTTQLQAENEALEGWSWTFAGARAGAEFALECMIQQAHEDEGCDGNCGGEVEEG